MDAVLPAISGPDSRHAARYASSRSSHTPSSPAVASPWASGSTCIDGTSALSSQAPGGGAEQTIEEHGGQHADDEGDRPRRRVLRLDEPTAEGPERQAPSVRARGERGEAAERGEVEREDVSAVLPDPPPEHGHARPRHRRPAEGEDRRCGSGRTRADRRARTRRRRGASRPPATGRARGDRRGRARARADRRDGRARRRGRTACARDPGSARGCPRTRPPARGPPTRRSRRG